MKKTQVTRIQYEDGSGSIEGHCDICGQFPCKHATEQGYFTRDVTLKINTKQEMKVLEMALRVLAAAEEDICHSKESYSVEAKYDSKRNLASIHFILGELGKLQGAELP
jgi:hypothetical protein